MGVTRNRIQNKANVLQKAYFEDYNFIVRMRPLYNSTSMVCNAIIVDEQLVLSDTTCVKYMDVANIEAKYIQIISNEAGNEVAYEVDKIYVNSPDPDDSGLGLTLLHTTAPIVLDYESRKVVRPEKMLFVSPDSKVRLVGYTNTQELKENRTRIAMRIPHSKYICTAPARVSETPGSQILKGAPLLRMIDFKHFQLIGLFSRVETFVDPATGIKMHQDCFVKIWKHIKWYEEVRALTSMLSGKDGGPTRAQPSIVFASIKDTD